MAGPIRPDPEKEVRDEIRFYLDMRAREFMEKEGLTRKEAEAAARRAFGDLKHIEDEVVRIHRRGERKRWWWAMAVQLIQNLKWSVRSWRRSPALALVALVTLALGIGATTAVFSLADRVLFRSPPVESPEELVRVYTSCRSGTPRCSSSWPDYQDYRAQASSLTDLAAYSGVPVNVSGFGAAFLARGTAVSGNYFRLLGVAASQGRLLQPGDNAPAGPHDVAVVSHSAWKSRFAGDPDVVGSTVELNGTPFQVVGVAPEGFQGIDLGDDTQVWIPMRAGTLLGEVGAVGIEGVLESRNNRWIEGLVGRRAPGASVERVRAELSNVSARLQNSYPDARSGRGVTVDPAPRYVVNAFGGAQETLRLIGLLAGVVAVTLILACANLANLLLARAEGRRRELAIRASLGAGRGRLASQLLIESVGLGVVGGALGLGVARGLLSVLVSFELPGGIPLADVGVALDFRVYAFALSLSAVTGVVFGALPALKAGRTDLVSGLKGERRPDRGRPTRTRSLLVAVQVALCLVLLVGAGLFLRTLRNGMDSDLGFDGRGVALARFNLTLLKYEPGEAQTFLDEALSRTRALPGVSHAGAGSLVPLQLGGHRATFIEVEGYEPGPEEELRVEYVFTTRGYFEAVGMEVVAGRGLGPGERAWPPEAAMINRTMARRYWPDEEAAVGGVILFGGQRIRVVGVVADATWRGLEDPERSFVFVPMHPGAAVGFTTLVARTDVSAAALLPLIRREIAELEPRLSLTSLQTMDDQLDRVLMPQRLGALILTSLGILALTLAGVGIWGVVGYAVRRRTREMGIRIALGAGRGRVLGTVMIDMLVPVVGGLAVGLASAWALARTVEAFMYGVPTTDPVTFGMTGLLLAAVAALATWAPARRATRVDPREALRVD